jgi:hypothetical protein
MTQAYNLGQLANKVNSSGQLNPATGLSSQVPVANGGTGLATLTANNVILGNGTSAVQFVAPGTAGNALVSNGTTWVAGSPNLAGSLIGYQIFTANGTYTKATNNPGFVIVYVVGGGGGESATGGTGGTTSFGAFCSATGGYGGSSNSSRPGGTGTGGDINSVGGGGLVVTGVAGTTNYIQGGLGAFALGYGNGPKANTSGGKTYVTLFVGGGGGGAIKKILGSALASTETVTIGAVGTNGSTSTAGICIVWEYQ